MLSPESGVAMDIECGGAGDRTGGVGSRVCGVMVE